MYQNQAIDTAHPTRQSLQEITIFKEASMTTFSKYTPTYNFKVTIATHMQHVFS